ncbi:hypothetical protein LO772_30365 [Yinghuangia sp. ASG 101]|uniref:hypothetical protein n=1 Tax=Yinghuangia sp. ASG 101 TaxID=2896848 RepID=UPI001E3BB2D2|nr:hypothetical protein [Yinghuangia sp. ASG 101]UGQ11066.1 hypothetical protein LO772_30365 [Yinghuangia sp. ASG 101]
MEHALERVVIGLHRAELPEHDAEFMRLLTAALGFGCPGRRSTVVLLYASVTHSAQLAVRQETSDEQRITELLQLSPDQLIRVRDEITEWAGHIHQLAVKTTEPQRVRKSLRTTSFGPPAWRVRSAEHSSRG